MLTTDPQAARTIIEYFLPEINCWSWGPMITSKNLVQIVRKGPKTEKKQMRPHWRLQHLPSSSHVHLRCTLDRRVLYLNACGPQARCDQIFRCVGKVSCSTIGGLWGSLFQFLVKFVEFSLVRS